MSRQDERERVRRQLGDLTARVGASRTAGVGIGAAGAETSARLGGGRWDLEQLPADSDPSERDRDSGRAGLGGSADGRRRDTGHVPSPGWLEEPVAASVRLDRFVPERFRGIRLAPGRPGLRALALVGLSAMAIATIVVFRDRPVAQSVPPLPSLRATAATGTSASAEPSHPGAPPMPTDPGSPPSELVVSVVGLVHRTGLVRLPAGSRVADALAAAGGPREGADTSGLNLAQRLTDGDQVLVGPAGPIQSPPQLGSTTINAGGRPASGSAAAPGRSQPPSGKVDLNTATEAELDALPGVGPVTAHAIVSRRNAHGRFTSIDQLSEVDGIGPARLARLRDLVTV